ncbi:MAG: hypothetical protein ABSC95_27260 [Acetobacteraceae bacterium]|jgi:hypothetical protein
MCRATVVLAAALLTLSAGASAGTLNAVSEATDPASASGTTDPPSTMLSGAPLFSKDLPEAASPDGQGATAFHPGPNTPEGASNGTVRMLLNPPQADARDND